MNKPVWFSPLVLTLLSGCVFHVQTDGGLQERQQVLEMLASDLTDFVANTGAGSLTIVGEAERSNIEVHAAIYYYDERHIQLSLERDGDGAILQAHSGDREYFTNKSHIDLTIKIPARLALKLDDGSGHTRITGLQADLLITDGTGHLFVQGGHNMTIVDGSGHLEIAAATGDVEIKDGSGHLQVREVKGNLTIHDISGDLLAQFIGGIAMIADYSGDIAVNQAGALTILEDTSGKVSIRDIRGETMVR